MKKTYIILIIYILYNFNLTAQFYLGQDKIDQLSKSKISDEKISGTKSSNYQVYLEAVDKINGYISDVIVGFDKVKYFRGEIVTLTFKRTGKNSKVENERIAILGTTVISGDGFEVRKGEHYSIFTLKQDEEKRVFVQLQNRNQLLDRIQMGIGRQGIGWEARSYLIPYSPPTNEIDNKNDSIQVKPKWEYFNQNNDQNNGTKDFYLYRQSPSNIV